VARVAEAQRGRSAPSTATWQSGATCSGNPLQVGQWASITKLPLVDVRSKQEFQDRHIAYAANIPLDELEARFYELPPKYDEPLKLFGSLDELQKARSLLVENGWHVDETMLDSAAEATWRDQDVVSGVSSARVWKPSEFLEGSFQKILSALPLNSTPSDKKRVAIDVGCGSGRDAVFLALALGPSWEVVAIDNHTKALQRAAELATKEGCEITCLDRDLRKTGMSDLRADLVHGSRFLCREMFPEIRDVVLNPGGVFVWSHFLEGCEVYAPPRKPSRQLMHGELKTTFVDEAGFEVIHDEEGILNTRFEEVPAAFFAARKPGQ